MTNRRRLVPLSAMLAGCAIAGWGVFVSTQVLADARQFNDSHFHLTNYVQEGISAQQSLSPRYFASAQIRPGQRLNLKHHGQVARQTAVRAWEQGTLK